MEWKRYHIGDGCLCWQLGDTIDSALSRRVIFTYRRIKAKMAAGELDLLDVVPSYNAVAVHFDPALADIDALCARIDALVNEAAEGAETFSGTDHRLSVIYNGPDLERVARCSGLSVDEVIAIHSAGTYQVAMIGFKPHYPYLIGLDPRLETPRLETPRTAVPAGSVAIGGAQTGVYPCESPGGWNIIGTTDPERLISIEPGDTVYFLRTDGGCPVKIEVEPGRTDAVGGGSA